nr:unnamed protein product [Digitaria exilis]
MASVRKSSFMIPSADTYARAAVRHIGYEPSMRLGMCIKIRKKGQAKDAKKKAL